MRTGLLAIALLSANIFAADPPPTEITTILGKTYSSVKIVAVDPDGLRFMHSAGAAKVKFSELPAELQERFGYDPGKAAQFSQQQSMAEAQRIQQIERARAESKMKMEAQAVAQAKAEANAFAPISAQDVRSAWIRSLSIPPSSLDRDYHDKVEQNNALKVAISGGGMDDQAKLTALEYNANKLRALGRIDEANAFQQQIVELEKAIAKREEAAAMKANAEALNNLVDYLSDY